MGTLGYCISSVGHNKSMKCGMDVVDNMGIHRTKFQLCPAKNIFFEKSKGPPLTNKKHVKLPILQCVKMQKIEL